MLDNVKVVNYGGTISQLDRVAVNDLMSLQNIMT